ncbi:hypothetical protein, partial [Mycobacterium tuberculosis]
GFSIRGGRGGHDRPVPAARARTRHPAGLARSGRERRRPAPRGEPAVGVDQRSISGRSARERCSGSGARERQPGQPREVREPAADGV